MYLMYIGFFAEAESDISEWVGGGLENGGLEYCLHRKIVKILALKCAYFSAFRAS